MRVSAPPSRMLQREALLRDVRARLADRLPQLAQKGDDATDPAWILLEQAAWMVERLSEQLDQYPFAALRQLFHVVGAELMPALPAVGFVVAAPVRSGPLRRSRELPDSTRFFTPRTEQVSSLEFVPVEDEVPLMCAEIVSLAVIRDGELFRVQCRREEGPLAPYQIASGEEQASALFHDEEVRLNFVAAGPGLAAALRVAVEAVQNRNIGWLFAEVLEEGERVCLRMRVDVRGALKAQNPDHGGGDIRVRWGSLDRIAEGGAESSDWCPAMRLSEDPDLPPALRGRVVARIGTSASFLIADVPPHFPMDQLLAPARGPIPMSALRAIWRTVSNQDRERLSLLKPQIQRSFGLQLGPDEPAWVEGALANNLWETLAERLPAVVHLRWPVEALSPDAEVRSVRISLAFSTEVSDDEVAVFRLDARGRPDREPTGHAVSWTLPLPAPRVEEGWLRVMTLEVPALPGSAGALLACSRLPRAVFLNSVLVVQAPAVRDGRLWTVQRQVPEPVSLLHEDLVSQALLNRVGEGVLPADALSVLARMPLARFEVEGEAPMLDLRGVGLDESAGRLTLHAPDPAGELRELRPGQRIRLSWYRRTDGSWGNAGARSISLVEQEPGISPKILAISNPLACWHGQARELPEAAVERLFQVGGGFVLPADFERLVRQVLGRRAPDWTVRAWTYMERTLFPWNLWPLEDESPERLALRRAMEQAGPEQLVIAVGPTARDLSDWDFEPIRQQIERSLLEHSRRIPRLRGCIVTRLWPLTLRLEPGAEVPRDLLGFDLEGLRGTLTDARGRSAACPGALQLLNAAIVRAEGGSS